MAYICGSGACEVEGCKFYSDYDVWFEDGSHMDLCSKHSGEKFDDPKVIQVIPQHGGDTVNIPIREN